MKNKLGKRIIASAMCVGMLLSLTPAMNISAAYDYTEVVEKTTSLNIIPEKINAEDFVTRKELAKFIYYMLNVRENGAIYGKEQFYDVDITNEYYEYISVMTGYNLMVGTAEGEFSPEMKTTFAQAVRVILNATGYYKLAREDTEKSFANTAASLGILDGVAYDADSEILVGELVQMIWNTMQLKAVETTISGESKHVVSGTTLLWHYHKIAESKGKVTANEYTSLNREEGTKEGCVVIDNTIYRAGTDYIKDMLGRNIRFYYKNHDDFDENIVMWAEIVGGRQYMFAAAEIKNVVGTSFTTETDYKKKVYSLSPVVNVIFNGKYRPYDARDLQPLIGSVELVDADGDRVYELAIVKSYVPYIVKSCDVNERIIYDKNGRDRIEIDDEAQLTMRCGGKVVALEALAADNILLVAADKTAYDLNDNLIIKSTSTMYDILVSTDIISAVAEEIDTAEGYALIGGEKYDIRAVADSAGKTSIEVGKEQKFYLDAFLNIVYCEASATESGLTVKGIYAFVTKTKYDSFEDKTSIRCIDSDGNWQTLEFAKKARVDGATYRTQSAIYNALTGTGIFTAGRENGRLLTNVGNNEYAYLAVYRLNDDGKISFIDTPYVNTQNETEENSLFLNYYRISGKEREIGVNAGEVTNTSQNYIFQRTWNDKYYIPMSFPIIQVPIDTATNAVMAQEEEERNYSAQKVDGSGIFPDFEGMVFNAGDERVPEFAVQTEAYNSAGERIKNKYRSNIITKVVDSVNADNETVKRISVTGPDGARDLEIVYYVENGVTKSKTPINEEKDPINTGAAYVSGVREISVNDLRKGDVIAYMTSGNQILGITRRFSFYAADGTMNTSYNLSYNSNTRYSESTPSISWGKLYLASDGSVQLYATDRNTRGIYDLSSASIYCYDIAADEFRTIELDELRDYVGLNGNETKTDRILITRRHSNGTDAVVYRNAQ